MRYKQLGSSDIRVSRICLGTMTWGQQNSRKEAFAQLDQAFDAGVNFIDTAEIYPSPINVSLCGTTESFIGEWLGLRKKRDAIILASKVAGPSSFAIRPHLHQGKTRLDRQSIIEACEASLKRLNIDYLDLYQLHWPERSANKFGMHDYKHDDNHDIVLLEESLETLGILVKQGKVRTIGLSNDTPWGVMRCIELAGRHGFPRIVSVQNPFNLLSRLYQIGLSEISLRENIGLLAYSPLGSGSLSGKYLDGKSPKEARLIKHYDYYSRYDTPRVIKALEQYRALAKRYDMDMAMMAIAFINAQDFLTSVIIGATTPDQLRDNIAADDLDMPQTLIDEINAIHLEAPNPRP